MAQSRPVGQVQRQGTPTPSINTARMPKAGAGSRRTAASSKHASTK